MNRGAFLVNIDNIEENDFVTSEVRNSLSRNKARNFWSSANDIITEGVFVDSEGNRLIFENWDPNEPNQSGEEDCVEIRTGHGRWNDVHCSAKHSFVCEKREGKYTSIHCLHGLVVYR